MSSFQEKLYNYEQSPPAGVWEKIEAALDDSHLGNEFPATLYNAESTPPPAAWERIAGTLDAGHPAVRPFFRRSYPLFRYAAAAIVITVVAFGIMKWTGNDEKSDSGTGLASEQPDTSAHKDVTPVQEPQNDIARKEDEDGQGTTPGSEESLAANKTPVQVSTPRTIRKNFAANDSKFETEPIYAYNEYSPRNLADRYVMLMTPNGIIRMSKKLGDLVCCVSGEEQDEDCREQLRKWQEKMAASPVTPAPGNFMDILSLVSTLNDKEL